MPRAFVAGDLLDLPFEDGRFAAVTVGWGVRNVPDVPRAFREMARVTRPGGRVVCLESTQAPEGPGKRFHDVWLGRVVPVLGRLVTGDPSAYAYLPASVAAFPRARRARRHHGRRRSRRRQVPPPRLRRGGAPRRRGAAVNGRRGKAAGRGSRSARDPR